MKKEIRPVVLTPLNPSVRVVNNPLFVVAHKRSTCYRKSISTKG